MRDLDDQIREALDEEDRALMEEFGEQGIIGQTFSMFQGKQGWIAAATVIASLGLFFVALFAAREFLAAPTIESKLHWAALAWGMLISISLTKIWFWTRMESNRVIREVKRIELQIARLNAKT